MEQRALRTTLVPALIAAASLASFVGAQAVGTQADGMAAAMPTTVSARIGAAHVVASGPTIDGRLDDAAWTEAGVLAGFSQREPSLGAPVSERTEVRIVTDPEALYIGAWLYDRDVRAIVPGEKIRDGLLQNSDYFSIILDTYHDRQNGFVFATTPAGIEYDGQVTREGEGGGLKQQGQTSAQAGAMGGFNVNWDGSWTVATSSDSAGWYAEFRIPFSTLRYGGGNSQTWGLNLARVIRRRNEDSFWAPIPRQFDLNRLSLAGTLTDLKVPVRRVATVTPYVIASSRQDFAAGQDMRYARDFGADAKVGLTPSLTLDLTYNTDFAQVEVDDQRTNLTRFPLFFPEKRPFFLENAGIFSAGTPQGVELFFSRRIGIDSMGTPLRIVGGGRLSGRVSGTTVGLLQILTDEAVPGRSGQSFTVARAVRELGRRSRVGVIGVQRMSRRGGEDVNRTYALDGRVGLGDSWTVDWWGGRTETPGRAGDDLGYSVRLDYVSNDWNSTTRIVHVGRDFNPEVGFLDHAGGYRYYEATLTRNVRKPEWSWFRLWNPHANFRGYFNLDGSYLSGRAHIDATEIEFSNGAKFGPELNLLHEGLREPFTISKGVTLPVGEYDFLGIGLDLNSDPSRALSVAVRGEFGPFYNGTRNGGSATLTLRRGATLSTSLLVDYNDVHLDQGNFIRSLMGVRLAYFFTPHVFVQSLTQFNNQQRIWSANARFAWLTTAGTGLFVVLNDSEEADSFWRWTRPTSRTLTVKYTRQIGSGR